MKKLLLLLSFASLFSCEPIVAQDTLAWRVSILEQRQGYAGLNLLKFNKQFNEWLYVICAGALLNTIGITAAQSKNEDTRLASKTFIYLGSSVMIFGLSINIDSFTFIRLAGIDLK